VEVLGWGWPSPAATSRLRFIIRRHAPAVFGLQPPWPIAQSS
jgi:hypothetical protein